MTTPPSVLNLPLAEHPQALVLDCRAYVVGARLNRSILATRRTLAPSANLIAERTVHIVKSPTSGPPTSHSMAGVSGNTLTIICASAPLRVRLTTETGVHDMGEQSLFITTAAMQGLVLENPSTETDVDVEIIHA